ncbi:MAG: TetR-like C-terminal domain-containing protein [Myxococcota bacterium]
MLREAVDDPAEAVCSALADGRLSAADLTARRLGEFLGKTTSVLYHRWGSLDAFLLAVAGAATRRLAVHLLGGGSLPDLSARFVAFGLDHPDLYALMFERRYDWDGLRSLGVFEEPTPGLTLWEHVVDRVEEFGSDDPAMDARLLYAGLHGLVSLASTGRANVGDLTVSDRDLAIQAARRLAEKMVP